MDERHKNKTFRGPTLRLVTDNERVESEGGSTSFEDIIAEIKGKSQAREPLPKSQLARQLSSFADELDKQIAELLAL